jgi:pimeloyl-ACP methyl ester carboxylesterase
MSLTARKLPVNSRPSQFVARIITIQTPQRFLLNGLWFGPLRPQTVFIYLHGLSGSVFYQSELAASLAGRQTAVITFNNRGSNIISGVRRLDPRSAQGYKYYACGMAHEVFTDCVDDIDGAVAYARRLGARRIFLLGHSTGCQKSIYYLNQRLRTAVTGAILLAPMSDYATVGQEADPATYRRALAIARRLVKAGQPHELLPTGAWPEIYDAQRFLSLYTPESKEEIFSYASGRKPAALQRIKQPLLVLLAGQDPFGDRPMAEIAAWFKAALVKQRAEVGIIKGVGHSFSPRQSAVRQAIKRWVEKIN